MKKETDMNYNRHEQLRRLTERFMGGETTVDEEQWLYEAYASGDIPADLQAYKPLMEGFASMLLRKTGAHDEDENAFSCEEPSRPLLQRPVRIATLPARHFRRYMAVAAGIIAILAFAVFYRNYAQPDYIAYVYGQRSVDERFVMSEMRQCINDVIDDEATTTMDSQLHDLFNDF
ncbi:MAG: hypothetical protein IJ196_03400 [Prevotella sp.]|nr:hypothetical protein [Prevotella sp.]